MPKKAAQCGRLRRPLRLFRPVRIRPHEEQDIMRHHGRMCLGAKILGQ
jgi:hypothetical protein